MRYWYVLLVTGLLLFGCSSKTTKSESDGANRHPFALLGLTPDTLSRAEIQAALQDTGIVIADSIADSLSVQLLERSREHYQNALDAQESGDSVHSELEFEYAIAILNELAFYPGIETNQEFNDLSRSVVEDYEKYIAVIDSLGPQTSIFALREKLNQALESRDTPEEDTPKSIITTTGIPLVINGHVQQNIDFFQNRGRKHFEHWLRQGGKYFPTMKSVFRNEGVPEELRFLAMIESGLNPLARSWARAVGMWQFIKGTGMLYGLTGNYWYDERRDFEKATLAAAKHLKDLYAEFGDWYLALAAYNSGAGRVSHAIRRSGSKDFWKLRPYLPRETRNYVPSFIAAAAMGLDPAGYGFAVEPSESITFDVVHVDESVDLGVLAGCAGTDVATLRGLNPELLKWCTPPGMDGYNLRIPAGKSEEFNKGYAQIPASEKRNWLVHKVRRGETLGAIARKYGLPTSLVAQTNHLDQSPRIRAGNTILIPVPSSSTSYIAEVDNSAQQEKGRASRRVSSRPRSVKGRDRLTYRIRKGDTLGKIAQLYGVRTSDLRGWNDLPYGSRIRGGDVLNIWVKKEEASRLASYGQLSPNEREKIVAASEGVAKAAPPKGSGPAWMIYTVKPGDNLGKIAAAYGVGAADIRRWNGLRTSTITVGKRLDILMEENGSGPQKAPAVASVDTAKTGASSTVYKVKKGDTLTAIAAAFGVSIQNLRSWNRIRGNRLVVGQELRINS